MGLPKEPIMLSVEQISELSQKLTTLRHETNNHLSLIMAAVELMRRRPQNPNALWDSLSEQPRKISEVVAQFSSDLEAALHITRP
jgi:hypothetical protein